MVRMHCCNVGAGGRTFLLRSVRPLCSTIVNVSQLAMVFTLQSSLSTCLGYATWYCGQFSNVSFVVQAGLGLHRTPRYTRTRSCHADALNAMIVSACSAWVTTCRIITHSSACYHELCRF